MEIGNNVGIANFILGKLLICTGPVHGTFRALHANVRVHVPRVIVAIDGTATAMHAVVPIAAANEGEQGCL